MKFKTICFISILFYFFSSNAQDTINLNGYNVFYYPNGAKKSEGYLENGKPNGYWKNYYENGNLKSEGNRKNFELDSTWIFYDEFQNKTLEINYKNGKKNGKRITYLKDEIIEENFENDIKNGYTYKYYPERKIKFKVRFINGREEGIGFEYSPEGTIITVIEYKKGFIINTENINRYREGKKHGVWKEFYDDDKIKWEGNYNYGKKDGFFKEYDINGNLVKIEKYKNDEIVYDAPELRKYDIRTEYYKNGKVKVIQSFKDGIPEGIRREYDQEGKIINSYIFRNGNVVGEGIIDEKGMKQGLWKEYFENGELEAEGNYKNNLKTGIWKFYYKNGKIEQTGSYNDEGKPEGKWIWYYESGNIKKEENFVRGKYNGLYVEYSENGKTIIKGEYEDGEETGEWYYEVGDEKQIGSYEAGKKEGLWRHYTGEMINFEGSFIEGNPNGLHTYYWENGKIKEQGKYVMGKKEGDWHIYDINGVKIITITYEDGIEVAYDKNKIDKNLGK